MKLSTRISQLTNNDYKKFETYRANHVALVQKLGKAAFNKDFSSHDSDKMSAYGEILDLWVLRNNMIDEGKKIPDDLKEPFNNLVANHVLNQPHHPEHFDNSITIRNFDNDNPPSVDCSKMPDDNFMELCADWSAVALKRNNNLMSFYNKNVGEDKRFKFTQHQKNLFLENILKIWKAIKENNISYPGTSYTAKNEDLEKLLNNKKIEESTEKTDLTETENFKKWFRNSKVVDKNGKPLVVYHSSNNKFDEFDPNKKGSNYNYGFKKYDLGFYFSNFGDAHYGKEIYKCYLSLQNPLIIEDEGWESSISMIDSMYSDIKRWIEEGKNYDGVICHTEEDDEIIYVAFNPNQIKSATDNNGEFSMESDRITESNNEDLKFGYSKIKTTAFNELSFYYETPDGNIVSLLHFSDRFIPDWFYIYGIETDIKYRGRGLATALIKKAIKNIEMNCPNKKIYLDVLADNRNSINLYQKLGFTFDNYYEEYADEIKSVCKSYRMVYKGVPCNEDSTPKAEKGENFMLNEKIVKEGNRWKVTSHDGKKNLGTYDTKAEAEKRLKQVEYFKNVKESTEKLTEDEGGGEAVGGGATNTSSGFASMAPERQRKIISLVDSDSFKLLPNDIQTKIKEFEEMLQKESI